jgi:hypothetical protein
VRRTLWYQLRGGRVELALAERDVFTASSWWPSPLAGQEMYHRLVQANDCGGAVPQLLHDRHAADASGVPPAGGLR